MLSPTGVIPEELMRPERKSDVIRFLQAQAYEGIIKRRLLMGYAVWVGIRLNKHDYAKVEGSGIDR